MADALPWIASTMFLLGVLLGAGGMFKLISSSDDTEDE